MMWFNVFLSCQNSISRILPGNPNRCLGKQSEVISSKCIMSHAAVCNALSLLICRVLCFAFVYMNIWLIATSNHESSQLIWLLHSADEQQAISLVLLGQIMHACASTKQALEIALMYVSILLQNCLTVWLRAACEKKHAKGDPIKNDVAYTVKAVERGLVW